MRAWIIFNLTYHNFQLLAGEKFGFEARNAMITDEEGAEIDSVEVIRDNDRIFIVEEGSDLHIAN